MNVRPLSDRLLLNEYLSGNRNAISKLIDSHRKRVYDYIMMMVKDGDVAEDICQDINSKTPLKFPHYSKGNNGVLFGGGRGI